VRAAILAGAILLGTSAAAEAAERIEAGTPNRYTTPAVTMDQGEPLTFRNNDGTARHDVTARDAGPDGRPLFSTPVISGGREVPVDGAQYLTAGRYAFFCSIHTFMTGTLTVTSAGTPVPRPADTVAPALSVAVKRTKLSRVARTGRLPAAVTVDEAADVALTASARVGRRTVTLGTVQLDDVAPGTRAVNVRVSRAGRRALARARSAIVTLRGTARDAAGNEAAARAVRRLRG
jgi:plastocyanin